MKYFPLIWSAIWRKPTEAVLVWLAVIASFTLFGLMVGLHASYDQVVATARLDRIYVNERFPSASAADILLPVSVRDEIARVEGVSAVASAAGWAKFTKTGRSASVRGWGTQFVASCGPLNGGIANVGKLHDACIAHSIHSCGAVISNGSIDS